MCRKSSISCFTTQCVSLHSCTTVLGSRDCTIFLLFATFGTVGQYSWNFMEDLFQKHVLHIWIQLPNGELPFDRNLVVIDASTFKGTTIMFSTRLVGCHRCKLRGCWFTLVAHPGFRLTSLYHKSNGNSLPSCPIVGSPQWNFCLLHLQNYLQIRMERKMKDVRVRGFRNTICDQFWIVMSIPIWTETNTKSQMAVESSSFLAQKWPSTCLNILVIWLGSCRI